MSTNYLIVENSYIKRLDFVQTIINSHSINLLTIHSFLFSVKLSNMKAAFVLALFALFAAASAVGIGIGGLYGGYGLGLGYGKLGLGKYLDFAC
ncbi:unnamed protein product [Orchesella dallaii]|uniref:Uncharacterized protein n=1 Tax=Orchesella dallaii TaxID=48710 RepID=A0ABP1QI04_9HEXA